MTPIRLPATTFKHSRPPHPCGCLCRFLQAIEARADCLAQLDDAHLLTSQLDHELRECRAQASRAKEEIMALRIQLTLGGGVGAAGGAMATGRSTPTLMALQAMQHGARTAGHAGQNVYAGLPASAQPLFRGGSPLCH